MKIQPYRLLWAYMLLLTALLGQGGNYPTPARRITFNGRSLSPDQQARLEILERHYRVRLPDAAFWYDNRTGAVGFWNGPAIGLIPPALGFGGSMPPNCSGGGTRVFVNGRELHPMDVAVLSQFLQVRPGRYWVDANGEFGYERGPRLGNLYLLSQQANRPRQKCYTCGGWQSGDPIVNEGGWSYGGSSGPAGR